VLLNSITIKDRTTKTSKTSKNISKTATPDLPTKRFDWFWLILIIVPPLLLFPRLGQIYLWQDEAETALLGQAILEHGYPLAVGGKQLISDQSGQTDVNATGVWIWTPWLHSYVTALSFAVFGATTWAARLPFALIGWAVLLLNYALLKDITRNRQLSRHAAILLVASVPFLLHARQCRYYMLFVLFTMLHAWGYARLIRQARGGVALFIAGGIGLYYSFFPVAGFDNSYGCPRTPVPSKAILSFALCAVLGGDRRRQHAILCLHACLVAELPGRRLRF
jgi:hypothetical protein